MKTPIDYVLINVEKKTNNEFQIGNHTLYLYDGELALAGGSYTPNERIRIFGEVVSVPERLSDDHMEFSTHKLSDCEMEVKIGDKAYFYYIGFSNENIVRMDGKMYLRVRYDHVICVVRDEEILPISGHILVKPLKKKETVILYETVKKKELAAEVIHIGSAYKNETNEFKKGDRIFFFPNSEFNNEIEKVEYYVFRKEFVMAKVFDDSLISA